ncbi:hypothetical protein F5146DRAFT_1135079 [Armillaria mellea]|nr:hypothetical protein F5146DRAFT_1135079 [Armillaria mellea]
MDGLEHKGNLASIYPAIGGPIFTADGFGLVCSEQEYGKLATFSIGWRKNGTLTDETSASRDWIPIYAQEIVETGIALLHIRVHRKLS